jgi:HEAT repeat protein
MSHHSEVYKYIDTCKERLNEAKSINEKFNIIDKIVLQDIGSEKLICLLFEYEFTNDEIDYIFQLFADMDPKNVPIYDLLELLGHDDAFTRNKAMETLQKYDDHIMYFIVKSLLSKDRDIRILALNVLGGVTFEKRREFIVELLEKEMDLNVAMTGVDYLCDIGQKDDLDLLYELKERFGYDEYVEFAVNRAINFIQKEL